MMDFPGIMVSWGKLARPLGPGTPGTAEMSATRSADASASAETMSAARAEFLNYAQMTPAERMRAAMLAKLGVTEEEMQTMDPNQQKAVEDKMREMIKQEAESDPEKKSRRGLMADITV